jgi:hypothetical protein
MISFFGWHLIKEACPLRALLPILLFPFTVHEAHVLQIVPRQPLRINQGTA